MNNSLDRKKVKSFVCCVCTYNAWISLDDRLSNFIEQIFHVLARLGTDYEIQIGTKSAKQILRLLLAYLLSFDIICLVAYEGHH